MNGLKLDIFKKVLHLHSQIRHAQMAESVDALVSNTSGAIHPGSIPGLGTRKIPNDKKLLGISFFKRITRKCSITSIRNGQH